MPPLPKPTATRDNPVGGYPRDTDAVNGKVRPSTRLAAIALTMFAAAAPRCFPQGDSGSFNVSGRVLDAGDSRPVQGAFVMVDAEQAAQPDIAGASTGPDGRFSVPGISGRRYRVTVERKGYATTTKSFERSQGDPAGPVSQAEYIEIRIMSYAVVAGRITDPQNEPLAGAIVHVIRMHREGRRILLSTINQTTTNDLGEYRIFGLESGRYYVGAYYQDAASGFGLRRRVALSRTDPSEQVTEDYAVTYYPGSPDPETATVVKLRPGQPTTGVDIQVGFGRSFRVGGTVAGVPSGTRVHIMLKPLEPGGLGALRSATPSLTGGFLFKSVPPGMHVLRADVMAGGQVLSARQEISVGSDTENVALELRPPFSVRGSVSVEGGQRLPAGCRLSLAGTDRPLRVQLEPDSEGHFHIGALVPDRYTVELSDESGGTFLKSATLDEQAIGAAGADISEPNHSLHILVSPTAAIVQGVAIDAAEHPAGSGVAVLVGVEAPDSPSYAVGIGHDGKFRFQSLSPGKYKVQCFSDLSGTSDATWDILGKVKAQGGDVAVAGGETQSLTIPIAQADSQ